MKHLMLRETSKREKLTRTMQVFVGNIYGCSVSYLVRGFEWDLEPIMARGC